MIRDQPSALRVFCFRPGVMLASVIITFATIFFIEYKVGIGGIDTTGINANLHQDDPKLLQVIRPLFDPPSELPILLRDARDPDRSQYGQSRFVDRLLNKTEGGFFVECGAGDGEMLSNTLFFETERNWTGLLIEADPALYTELQERNRKSHSINSCVSSTTHASKVEYISAAYWGGIREHMDPQHEERMRDTNPGEPIQVTCFPFYSILLALGINQIDYFSLDVEGAELPILATIPYDKIRINVISIEYRIVGFDIDIEATKKKLQEIRELLNKTQLYIEKGTVGNIDVVFQRIDSI